MSRGAVRVVWAVTIAFGMVSPFVWAQQRPNNPPGAAEPETNLPQGSGFELIDAQVPDDRPGDTELQRLLKARLRAAVGEWRATTADERGSPATALRDFRIGRHILV